MNMPSWYLGTVAAGKQNVYDGTLRVMDEKGAVRKEFSAADYTDLMAERTVASSYAKEVYLDIDGSEHMYRVGPLARINVADSMETERAEAELAIFRKNFGRPCHNAVLQIYAKLIELIGACEKARDLSASPVIRGDVRVPAVFPGSRGVAHIEAPRGTLIHDYQIDAQGIVRSANMIVATQQNTKAINASLKQGANNLLPTGSDEEILNRLEFVVRCYDPCLACATHALGRMELEVEINTGGKTIRKIRRK
jgi:F420-non-reducing hydrogenase large subunit